MDSKHRQPQRSRFGARAVPVLALGCGLWALRRGLRHRQSFDGKTVVITGGARGLGLELARRWTQEGAKVAICSRSATDLQAAADELGKDTVLATVCDITSREQVRDLIDEVRRRLGPVDVLINNAGVIQVGPVDCMTLDDYRLAMQTHFWGPLHLIEAVLPDMRRRRRGTIVNIASIGGKISVPHLLPYSASKFALVGLSEGLHAELAQHGINVITISPGLMRTGSPRNALFKGRHRDEYAWFSISDSLPGASMSSKRAARQIVEACREGRSQAVLSLAANLAARGHALFPEFSSTFLGWFNRLLPSPGGIGTRSARGDESFSAWSPSPLTALNERAALKNNEVR